jgi:Fungal Zn(2)-Cys(6) binuclear cluster domain
MDTPNSRQSGYSSSSIPQDSVPLVQSHSENVVNVSTVQSPRRGSKSTSAPASVPPMLSANAKVPIPRQRSIFESRYSRRVPKACLSCRQRKTKCSGDVPVCKQCRGLRIYCKYSDGMRDRVKRLVQTILFLFSFLISHPQFKPSMLWATCANLMYVYVYDVGKWKAFLPRLKIMKVY